MAVIEQAPAFLDEPLRTVCDCGEQVLVVVVPAVRGREAEVIIASPYEWEARTRCYVCANNAARVGRPCPDCSGREGDSGRYVVGSDEPCERCDGLGVVDAPRRFGCSRCGGMGYVGESRPAERMLAIDVAWSDEGHIRLIEPATRRRKGEALYRLHGCDKSDIVVPSRTY